MNSIWVENSNFKDFKELNNDVKTDVLIIGGGIAGILLAHRLHEAGVEYMLVEKDKICRKTTANTTAKITAQHGLIYSKIIKEFGQDAAKLYLNANLSAIEEYKALSKQIDCDFEQKDSYVYAISDSNKLFDEIDALKSIGFKAKYVKNLPLPFDTLGAVEFKNQAQFNPLKLLSEISENLNIFENTTVLSIKNGNAITSRGNIKANIIVCATHFPFINKHGSYFLKMYQSRSYCLGLQNATDVDGMYVDQSGNGLSFRNYKDILLLGGGTHRTGKCKAHLSRLEKVATSYYPDAEIKYKFATQDCMSLDGVAYIGQYSALTPNLYVATGFNKWGMTTSMVAAELLTQLITGKQSKLRTLYSPSRSILRKQLVLNAAETVHSLTAFSTKRCSHLGCTLKYNKAEHSWDCACHGSRFDSEGHLLNGPATKDINL